MSDPLVRPLPLPPEGRITPALLYGEVSDNAQSWVNLAQCSAIPDEAVAKALAAILEKTPSPIQRRVRHYNPLLQTVARIRARTPKQVSHKEKPRGRR